MARSQPIRLWGIHGVSIHRKLHSTESSDNWLAFQGLLPSIRKWKLEHWSENIGKLSTNVLSRARAEIGGRRDCFRKGCSARFWPWAGSALTRHPPVPRPEKGHGHFGLAKLGCWTRQEGARFQDADKALHSKTSKKDLTAAVMEYRISLFSITTSKRGVSWTFEQRTSLQLSDPTEWCASGKAPKKRWYLLLSK